MRMPVTVEFVDAGTKTVPNRNAEFAESTTIERRRERHR
jgi:hypothetical protein